MSLTNGMKIADIKDGLDILSWGLDAIDAIQAAMQARGGFSSRWPNGLMYLVQKMDDEIIYLQKLCDAVQAGEE